MAFKQLWMLDVKGFLNYVQKMVSRALKTRLGTAE